MSEDSRQGFDGPPQPGGGGGTPPPQGGAPSGDRTPAQQPLGQANDSLHRPVTPSPQATSSPARPPGAPDPAPSYPTTPPADWFSRLLTPAYESKGWLKFLGVVMIVLGALLALTIIGLLFAWLYIWVGVLLWQAGDRATWAHSRRDPLMLEQYVLKIKTVIVIAGVVVAIKIVLAVLAIGFAFTLGGLAALMESVRY